MAKSDLFWQLIEQDIAQTYQLGKPSDWKEASLDEFLMFMNQDLKEILRDDVFKAKKCGLTYVEKKGRLENIEEFRMDLVTLRRYFRYNEEKGSPGSPKNRNCFAILLGYNSADHYLEEKKKEGKKSKNIETPILRNSNNERVSQPKINSNQHYFLPKRPPYFKGRADKLNEIHGILTNQETNDNILLISGVGGIGKTTLIHEYIQTVRCQAHFEKIIYISVNKNLEGAFIGGVAAAFGLDLKLFPHPEAQLEEVVKTLQKEKGNHLLVVDNINEHDKEDLVRLRDTFALTGWRFLITTRTSPDGFLAVSVNELSFREAAFIFAHHYLPPLRPSEQAIEHLLDSHETILHELLTHVHQHTLLVELLGKVGKKKGWRIAYLLQHLKEQDEKNPFLNIGHHKEALQRKIEIGTHAKNAFKLSQSTLHSYILSLFEPELLNEAGKTMLRFFSILPPEDLPIEDLKILWKVEKQAENQFENRLDDLQQSGWFSAKYHDLGSQRVQHYSYKMHPLVQEVVYEKIQPNIDNVRPLVLSISAILTTPLKHPQVFQNYAKSVIDKLNYLNKKQLSSNKL